MVAETARKFKALEAQAAMLMDIFIEQGYEPVAPAVIQPASIFLDQMGEALRARTYVFNDPDGEELCLRPDLTVPTCRLYLERHPEANMQARFCYNGSAFRFQPGGETAAKPREFRQAGIELLGASDQEKADAEVVSLAVKAVRSTGIENFSLHLGDLGIFRAILEAMDVPERWRNRLKHHFWRREAFNKILNQLARIDEEEGEQKAKTADALLKKINPDEPKKTLATVEEYFAENSIPFIGARSLEEIAERLMEQAADAQANPLDPDTLSLIQNYLSISGPPKASAARIADLVSAAGLDLRSSLDSYMRRLDLLSKAGVNLSASRFSAEFGRNLEYYTGLVFQVEIPGLGKAGQIAGGGRYDNLLHDLGAGREVPAVGLAIHTERLLVAVEGEGE